MWNMQTIQSFLIFFAATCLVNCEDSCEVNRVQHGKVLRKELVPVKIGGHEVATKEIYIEVATSSLASGGSSLHVICDAPYQFQGDGRLSFVEIICTNGKWLPFPVCLLPPCDKRTLNYPGLDKTGERTFFHGESFEPRCAQGYRVAETVDRNITCIEGQWTGSLPPCTKEVQCKLLEKPMFGSMELYGNSATVGSVVIFKCDAGRKLVGSPVSKCHSDGEWTSPTPNCVVGCKIEPLLDFSGLIMENKRTFDDGEWFEPRCDVGFQLANETAPRIYCRDGKWEGSFPPCISLQKTPCSTIALSVYDGFIVENRISVEDGESFQPKCDEGFEISNKDDPEIYCRDGKWVGNLPPCSSVSCTAEFLSVFDGLIVDNNALFSDGEELEIRCISGYEPASQNESKIFCRKGHWEVTVQPCVPLSEVCHVPAVSNGDLGTYEERIRRYTRTYIFNPVNEGTSLNEEESLTLKCHDGYIPRGEKNKEITIFCLDGILSPEPQCVKPPKRVPCATDSLLGFAGVVLSNIDPVADGDWIQPMCAEGYEHVDRNATKLYCREGVWDGNLPPCYPAPCLDYPPIPENGRIKPTWWHVEHGSKVEYECLRNFEMSEGSVICSFGKWTGSLPACRNAQCKVISVENGEMLKEVAVAVKNDIGVTGTEIVYEQAEIGSFESSGSILQLSCFEPYRFLGGQAAEGLIRCQGGKWAPSPRCELAATCSMKSLYTLLPRDIVAFTDDSSDKDVAGGTVLKLGCRLSGMVFKGKSNAICTGKGTWTVRSDIQCSHGCGKVQISPDSYLIVLPDKRSYNFGESVTFSCPDGMFLTNDVERSLCLRYGWEPNTIPDCAE